MTCLFLSDLFPVAVIALSNKRSYFEVHNSLPDVE